MHYKLLYRGHPKLSAIGVHFPGQAVVSGAPRPKAERSRDNLGCARFIGKNINLKADVF